MNKPSSFTGPEAAAYQIRRMREKLGMTQQQLADRAKIPQSMIAGIESGRLGNLCFSTLQKLGEALNCEAFVRLIPEKDPDLWLDERSTELARRIIAATSGSTAIELQLPDQKFIEAQLQKTKEDILKNHRSALWLEK